MLILLYYFFFYSLFFCFLLQPTLILTDLSWCHKFLLLLMSLMPQIKGMFIKMECFKTKPCPIPKEEDKSPWEQYHIILLSHIAMYWIKSVPAMPKYTASTSKVYASFPSSRLEGWCPNHTQSTWPRPLKSTCHFPPQDWKADVPTVPKVHDLHTPKHATSVNPTTTHPVSATSSSTCGPQQTPRSHTSR